MGGAVGASGREVPRPGPRAERASEEPAARAAAGLVLESASDGVEGTTVLVLVYTVVATSTVAVPVVATPALPATDGARLVHARRRLAEHGRAVTATMMVLVGLLITVSGATHL